MKHLLLSVALGGCLLLPTLTHAQRRQASFLTMGSTVGVKLGASFSGLSGSDATTRLPATISTSYDSKIGAVVGGLWNYRFTNAVSFQAEANYVGRGFVIKTVSSGVTQNRNEKTVNLHYVEVPLLLKLNAKIFFVEGGVVGSYMVAGSAKEKTTTPAGNTSTQTGEAEGIKPLELGSAIGGGFELTQGGFFGVRYVRGFSSVSKSSGNLQLNGLSLEQYSIQITAGYIFNHAHGRGRGRR